MMPIAIQTSKVLVVGLVPGLVSVWVPALELVLVLVLVLVPELVPVPELVLVLVLAWHKLPVKAL